MEDKLQYIIRILSGIISALLVCITMAWMNTTPKSVQRPDAYYNSFSENFVMPFVFAVLIYTFLAVPYSIIVDRVVNHFIRPGFVRQVTNVILYVIGGIMAFLLFITILDGGLNLMLLTFGMIYLGAISACIFLVILRILQFVNRKIKSKI